MSSPILNVTTTVIWRSSYAQAKSDIDTTLSQVGTNSLSRSQEYSVLAMDALQASRSRKIAPKKLAKKMANDSAKGID